MLRLSYGNGNPAFVLVIFQHLPLAVQYRILNHYMCQQATWMYSDLWGIYMTLLFTNCTWKCMEDNFHDHLEIPIFSTQ